MTPIASAGSPARAAGGTRRGFWLRGARRLWRRRQLGVHSLELAQEVLVVLDGHLVDETAHTFEERLEALPATPRVVLDLSRLRGLDRAGVEAIRRLRRSPDQEVLAFADRPSIRRRLLRQGGGTGVVLLAAPIGM